MTEPVTKSVKVTFKEGAPLGVRGSFKRDGEQWIAIPLTRYTAIVTLIDRFIGIFYRVQADMFRMINDHPEDARRCAEILGHASRARTLHRELVQAKVKL